MTGRRQGVVLSFLYWSLRRLLELVVLRRRSEREKEIEILLLHHQLRVLERQVARPRLTPADRALLAAFSGVLSRPARQRLFFVTPATLLRWHRELDQLRGSRHLWGAQTRSPAVRLFRRVRRGVEGFQGPVAGRPGNEMETTGCNQAKNVCLPNLPKTGYLSDLAARRNPLQRFGHTCHAGDRGFESRRSRQNPCKTACVVVWAGSRFPRWKLSPARATTKGRFLCQPCDFSPMRRTTVVETAA